MHNPHIDAAGLYAEVRAVKRIAAAPTGFQVPITSTACLSIIHSAASTGSDGTPPQPLFFFAKNSRL
jgi:hypothetical protein